MESQFVGFLTVSMGISCEQNRGGDDHGNDDDGTCGGCPFCGLWWTFGWSPTYTLALSSLQQKRRELS